LANFNSDENTRQERESTLFFQEAVFTAGRQKLEPIIAGFQGVKDALEKELKAQGNRFKPKAFYSHLCFRDLENKIIDIFGFRDVTVAPHTFLEGYDEKDDDFQSKVLNCWTWLPDETRFPIEALITDDGFYDSSKQLRCHIVFTLGIIRFLTAEELTAIFIHEFGHNIDPALVVVNYVETNVFSKYITDRVGKISPAEKKFLEKKHGLAAEYILLIAGIALIGLILIVDWVSYMLFNPEKALEKIRLLVQKDKSKFTRQESTEAFADNFARMYGLGGPLMVALSKVGNSMAKGRDSRITKEKKRQRLIANITMMMIHDVHKTEIHRVHALIREYEIDLKDPNIPAKVKKDIKADLDILKEVLYQYLNHRDEFQRRINRVIYEELKKLDETAEMKTKKKSQ